MASKTFTMKFFSLLISSFVIIQMAMAGDPDILTDFVVPPNVTDIDGTFFTFTGLRELYRGGPSTTLQVSKVRLAEFPALNGQSVSYALHFVVLGTLQVGFVDTTNKLFNQTLQTGDIFVFPKGLVHFQYNADANQHAVAIAAFGSANAGTVSIPNTLFTTGIDDAVFG
ncbi:hypothetical protein ACJW30_08G125100 [Castanea mollissima]